MSYAAYVRSRIPDFVLCALACVALGLNVVQGFHIADAVAENVALVAAATVVPVAAMYLVGYSKRSLLVGVPALVLAAVVYAIVLTQMTSTSLFEESYDNSVLFAVVLLPMAVVVYALTRTRPGIIVCFVAGCVTCGLVQFLYAKDLVAPTLAFMVACASLFLLKSSLEPLASANLSLGSGHSAGRAQEADDGDGQDGLADAGAKADDEGDGPSARRKIPSFFQRLPRVGMALGLALSSAMLGLAVFMLVIAPLNPPAHELKLITEYYSLEEVHVSGILAFLHQRNDQISSSNYNDETVFSNETDEDEVDADGGADSESGEGDDQLAQGSFSANVTGALLRLIRYFRDNWWLLLLVLAGIVLLWLLVIAGRRALRKRRMNRWRALGPRNEYLSSFEHVCSTLERARLLDRGSKTPLELAASSEELARRLERQSETGFPQLAECFARVTYGLQEPTSEELADVESYVALLPKRLSRTIGRFRYIKHFFRV